MRIVRLFWAGVQIDFDGATIVIDLLEHTDPLRSMLGDPRLPPAFAHQPLDESLVTHLFAKTSSTVFGYSEYRFNLARCRYLRPVELRPLRKVYLHQRKHSFVARVYGISFS